VVGDSALPKIDDILDVVSDAVVEEYWERGYWTSPKLFSDEQIAQLRAAHQRFWARDLDSEIPSQYGLTDIDPNSHKLRQDCNGFWVNREIRRAVTSPLLGAIAARLMKTGLVRLWHDQVIYKPGLGANSSSNTGNVGWHQDYGYWQSCSTTNMVTAWVALQDTDLSNGGMRTIVGSHKWGLITDSNSFHTKDLEALSQKFAAESGGEWIDEPCILKAGEVSFHHALTFHGSGPNLTNEPRLSVVAHMMPGDATYRAGIQWHPNLLLLGPNATDGTPFIGDFWPQMWPPMES
jgi:ectoine hydroxylase-related dioxygenase (phytanoyl-CoA dioxygenase family)